MTPEQKCNGNARHAFYELQGLKYEATERYVGKTDRAGMYTMYVRCVHARIIMPDVTIDYREAEQPRSAIF